MALYFFHLRNSHDRILDDAGQELDGPAAARAAAIREARAIIAADALTGHIDLHQHIEVEDIDGQLVCQIPLAEAVTIRQ